MIGAIADDFTGATDIAVAFRRSALRVVLVFDRENATPVGDADVVVIAQKTRAVSAATAVEQSLDALRWLQEAGAEQFFFKYCSTFDSRDEGNIGPVADALAEALGAPHTVFVPSSPAHQRTQYMGHLFVGGELLSDSPMRHHPLTPMTDSSIPRVLSRQTPRHVGLVDHRDVREGSERIAERIAAAEQAGTPYLVVDAVCPADLLEIGAAVSHDPLVTGAAGLADGFGAAYARRLGIAPDRRTDTSSQGPVGPVRAAALAGSCSSRTLEQVEHMRSLHPHLFLDAAAHPDPVVLAESALAWFDAKPDASTPLLFSSQPPEDLRRTQEALGIERASQILETATGLIARGLVERGVRRLVVAGGETSGAVVTALGVTSGEIGSEVAAGVPWIYTHVPEPIALLLKSGNFGDSEMLDRALHQEQP